MGNFQLNWKKLLLLLGFIVLAAAIGWLMYRLFLPAKIGPALTPDTQTPSPGDGLPAAGDYQNGQVIDQTGGVLPPGQPTEQGPTQDNASGQPDATRDNKISGLTDHRAQSPVLNENGAIQYYNYLDGRFYRLDADGQAELMSDKIFNQVADVTWSPQQNKAVLYYPDGNKTIYNFDTQQQVTLPQHWDDFSWAPDGSQLIFKSLGAEVENRWLATVAADGTGAKQIEPIGVNAGLVITDWSPNNQVVAFLPEGLDYDRKLVYFIGLNGENFRALTTAGRGFESQWSPQGGKLLFSTYSSADEYKPMLWRTDAQGDAIGNNRVPLDLQTWAHKCAFFNDAEAYCAVPQYLPTGAGLFPDTAKDIPDDLYVVNLDTGQKTLVDSGQYNMQNLMVAPDLTALYFTDGFTGRLHKLDL